MKTARLSQTAGACCLVAIVLASTSITSGQVVDTLVKAKALYAEASYDEALVVLRSSDGAEAYQYRALCFLALGKTQDAERALESLINVAPTYVVSDADLPPRLVNMFAQTRRRVMPSVVKRLFTEARADFQGKNLIAARDKFEKVLTLTHDPAMADSAEAVDLQLLVASYIDIVKNSLAPVPASSPVRTATANAPVMPSPSAPAPAVVRPAPAATVPAVTTPPAATPAAASAISAGATTSTASAASALATSGSTATASTASAVPAAATPPAVRELVPAITIQQSLPAFQTSPGQQLRPMTGAVRVTIGSDGKVKAAAMEVSIEPRYDARVLAAAKSWTYKPATFGGEPITSEKVVQIKIER